MGAGIALGFDYPQLRKGRTTQGQTGQNRWFCGEVCPSQESKLARLEILSECKRLVTTIIATGLTRRKKAVQTSKWLGDCAWTSNKRPRISAGLACCESILLPGSGQLHGLRAVVGSVFHVQGSGARARGLRGELHREGALALGRHAAAAGVGLGKITGVRTREADAADGQCRRQIVGQGHRLSGTAGLHRLRGEGKRGGRPGYLKLPRPGQRNRLRTVVSTA